MVVVAIIGVLVAVSVPIFNSQLEKSREATDLANVRSAYAQVMTEAISKDGLPEPVAVFLKQTQDNWQTKLPITIGGVTYNGTQSDNWKGNPKNKGMCRVSYEKDRGNYFQLGRRIRRRCKLGNQRISESNSEFRESEYG